MEYKGQLKGFPKEIVDKMLEYQVAQGKKKNITVFEELADDSIDGFNWYGTVEKAMFWGSVISDRNFNLFFNKYPKGKEGVPEVTKPELIVGNWYKVMLDNNIICMQYAATSSQVMAFDYLGHFNTYFSLLDFERCDNYESANEEAVKTLFKAELKRRGLIEGNCFVSLNNGVLIALENTNFFFDGLIEFDVITKNHHRVYENGVFAKAYTLADFEF